MANALSEKIDSAGNAPDAAVAATTAAASDAAQTSSPEAAAPDVELSPSERHDDDPRHRPVAVIINATSGSADTEMASDIVEGFRRHGIEARVHAVESGAAIAGHVAEELRNGCGLIVAGGGDGTINAVASALLGTEATLGVLPLGTLNHFAKDLGIPLDLDKAIETIATGRTIAVDVGSVNRHLFLNNSSLGLYPVLVRLREQHQRLGWGKWPAFARAMITALGRYPFLNVRIQVEGKEMIRRTPIVFIGNNQYEIHGLNIGSRTRLDRGEICLYLTRDVSRAGLIWLSLRALFGRLRDADNFESFCATELRVDTTRRRMRVATDGEVTRMSTPLHYRIEPGALRVIVPVHQTTDKK